MSGAQLALGLVVTSACLVGCVLACAQPYIWLKAAGQASWTYKTVCHKDAMT